MGLELGQSHQCENQAESFEGLQEDNWVSEGERNRRLEKKGHDEESCDTCTSPDSQAYQKDIHIKKGVAKRTVLGERKRNAYKCSDGER